VVEKRWGAEDGGRGEGMMSKGKIRGERREEVRREEGFGGWTVEVRRWKIETD